MQPDSIPDDCPRDGVGDPDHHSAEGKAAPAARAAGHARRSGAPSRPIPWIPVRWGSCLMASAGTRRFPTPPSSTGWAKPTWASTRAADASCGWISGTVLCDSRAIGGTSTRCCWTASSSTRTWWTPAAMRSRAAFGPSQVGQSSASRLKIAFNTLSPSGESIAWAVRFNPDAFPGSDHITVTRLSTTTWEIEATSADRAVLVSGVRRTQIIEGPFTMPFKAVLTSPPAS